MERTGYVALPSRRNPWFLIPTDDPGAFRYFVLNMLSSKYSSRRVVIGVLKLFVQLGGHRLWPVIGRLISQ